MGLRDCRYSGGAEHCSKRALCPTYRIWGVAHLSLWFAHRFFSWNNKDTSMVTLQLIDKYFQIIPTRQGLVLAVLVFWQVLVLALVLPSFITKETKDGPHFDKILKAFGRNINGRLRSTCDSGPFSPISNQNVLVEEKKKQTISLSLFRHCFHSQAIFTLYRIRLFFAPRKVIRCSMNNNGPGRHKSFTKTEHRACAVGPEALVR